MSNLLPHKRKGLGKGLSGLFDSMESHPSPLLKQPSHHQTTPNKEPAAKPPTAQSNNTQVQQDTIQDIAIQKLITGRYQPRHTFHDTELQEMASSITAQGILHPLIVRKNKDQLELIAGERRLRGARLAGLQKVPCRLLNISDQEALEISLLENIQRADLSPVEEAKGYERLIKETNYTQETLGKKLGKSRTYLANTLRLLKLPDTVHKLLDSQQLSAGHARALIGHPKASTLAEKAVKNKWSVRQIEAAARTSSEQKNTGKKTTNTQHRASFASAPLTQPSEEKALAASLSHILNTPVHITLEKTGGTLHIRFRDPLQLDKLLQKLSQQQATGPRQQTITQPLNTALDNITPFKKTTRETT